ncbi:uncharacterized protein LOC142469153 [Ascaphus truei]|uniref:uncharacterized protein LOC142469153 n=1 Tax=Ascaphus truei TaxID=8439 RepID=UPI003F5A883B
MMGITEVLEDCVTESSLSDKASLNVHFAPDWVLEDVESEVDVLGKTHEKKRGGQLAVDEKEGDIDWQELYNSSFWAIKMMGITEVLEDCVTEYSLSDKASLHVHFAPDWVLEDVESEVDVLGKTYKKKGRGEVDVGDKEGNINVEDVYNSGFEAIKAMDITEVLEDYVTESSLSDKASLHVHFSPDWMLEDVESEVDALDQHLEEDVVPLPCVPEYFPAYNTLQAQNIEGDCDEYQKSPGCYCCIWTVRPKRSLFSSIRRWISKRRNRVVPF